MNTIRMYTFVAAVVVTASLLFVIAYGLPAPQPTQAAVPGTVTDTQSPPD
jgi:hypothetical protein